MARKPTDTVNLRLRLPEGLRKELAARADKANRSLNGEILWRLGQTFGEQWQRFIAGMEEVERTEQEILERMKQDPEFNKALAEMVARLPKKNEQQ